MTDCIRYAKEAHPPATGAGMSFEQFRSSLNDSRLIRLAEFWQSRRSPGRLPGWKDIDPVEIAPCLPIIWAWRWDPAESSFIGILAGEDIILGAGRNPARRRLDTYFPAPVAPTIAAQFGRVMNEPVLVHATRLITNRLGYSGRGERIVLPLATDGVHGDALVGASVYQIPGSPHAPESEDQDPANDQSAFFALD